MKRKRLITIMCTILITLIIIYKLSESILRNNSLAFMNIINYTFYGTCWVLVFLILIQSIVGLFNIAKNRLLRLFLGFISIILIPGLFLSVSVIFAFIYEPEHIVEKEDKKMVAYVNSFLQVNVNYYDYVNQLVRGTKLKISEDYGNGGYDPFESKEMPTVHRYTHYDDNGEVIKSN